MNPESRNPQQRHTISIDGMPVEVKMVKEPADKPSIWSRVGKILNLLLEKLLIPLLIVIPTIIMTSRTLRETVRTNNATFAQNVLEKSLKGGGSSLQMQVAHLRIQRISERQQGQEIWPLNYLFPEAGPPISDALYKSLVQYYRLYVASKEAKVANKDAVISNASRNELITLVLEFVLLEQSDINDETLCQLRRDFANDRMLEDIYLQLINKKASTKGAIENEHPSKKSVTEQSKALVDIAPTISNPVLRQQVVERLTAATTNSILATDTAAISRQALENEQLAILIREDEQRQKDALLNNDDEQYPITGSSWIKRGYFRPYGKYILGVRKLSVDDGEVVFNFYRAGETQHTETLNLNQGQQSKSFSYDGKQVTLTLRKIAVTGNKFKLNRDDRYAAHYDIRIDKQPTE